MKLLREAVRRFSASPRALTVAILSLLGALIPTAAFASEADVQLDFSRNNGMMYLWISLAFGILSVIFAFFIARGVMAASPGNEKMQEVGLAIREGALAYLKRQIMTMIWFVIAIAIGLYFLYNNVMVSVAFVGGVMASYIAGYSGMVMAVNGNMRTAHAALSSYKKSLEVAFRSGAVAGMVTVGMGLIGATVILMFGGASAMTLLIGFGFGGSLLCSCASAAASSPRPRMLELTWLERSKPASRKTIPATPPPSPTTSVTMLATAPVWPQTSSSLTKSPSSPPSFWVRQPPQSLIRPPGCGSSCSL